MAMHAARHEEPWDRKTGETPPAWEAFRCYRDMGTSRSLTKVAQQLAKSRALMKRWSSEHGWVVRAAAWDSEQDRLHLLEMADERRKAARRGLKLASVLTAAATRSAVELTNSSHLKAAEVARLGEAAARIQQVSFALDQPAPDRQVRDQASVEVAAGLTDEERRNRMEHLRAELTARLEQ